MKITRQRKYYLKNREKSQKATKEWSLKNKDKIKEWRDKNSIKIIDYTLRKKYGISLEEYNNLMQLQNNCCAICSLSQLEQGRRFAVDHNHATGEVRGLLCHSCNVAIGLMKESEDTLLKAIKYLKSFY